MMCSKYRRSTKAGEMLRAPIEPADDIDLPFVGRPQVRLGPPGEVAHDRVRLPKAAPIKLEYGNFAVGIEGKKRGYSVLSLAQIDADEFDGRVQISCNRTNFSGIQCLGVIELHQDFLGWCEARAKHAVRR